MSFVIEWSHLHPLAALGGGVLIGTAAGLLALGAGKIMGCSGIVGAMLHDAVYGARAQAWRGWFMGGVLLGGLLWLALGGTVPGARHALPAALVLPAGLLTGFGTRLGSGCTSGHGVCGLPRLSPRSLLAVALFMCSGMVTVFLTRQLGAWL
jgi:uncharacterized membrane protein YedE/YeeE